MEKRIAGLLSYIAHPLLMPMYGLLVITNSGTYAADLNPSYLQFIYMAVFVFTLVIPAAILPLFYYFGLTRNIQFSARRERLIPLYITIVFYLAAYFLIRRLPISSVYQRFIFAACVSIFLLLVVSYFWKISAHMIGWGGLTGLILMLSIKFNSDLMIFLIASLLMSGFTGFARLKLEEHNPFQIYLGYFIGIIVMIAVFMI